MNARATWPQSLPLAAARTTQGSSVLRLASTHTLSALCIFACRMGARSLAFTLLWCFKHKELRENASWRNWKRYLSTYLTGDKCYSPRVFPGSSDGRESSCNAGDLGSVPGLVRSPGERNGNPLQYSCLEKSMDRDAWQATVHGVAKSRTRLSLAHLLLGKNFSLGSKFSINDTTLLLLLLA